MNSAELAQIILKNIRREGLCPHKCGFIQG